MEHQIKCLYFISYHFKATNGLQVDTYVLPPSLFMLPCDSAFSLTHFDQRDGGQDLLESQLLYIAKVNLSSLFVLMLVRYASCHMYQVCV